MKSKKLLKLFLLISLLITSLVYTVYPRFYINTNEIIEKYTLQDNTTDIEFYNGTEDYLIDTPGCFIPNYMKTMKINEARPVKKTCGERAVFIKKLSNDVIVFKIDEIKMKRYTKKQKYFCCYKFASPTIVSGVPNYKQLTYSNCEDFKDGTESPLKEEFVTVTCKINSNRKQIIYEDAYAILKKINRTHKHEEKSWNILMLGMDTMSRARVYKSMPKITNYMTKNNWLDYRGYQKVGYNTFPNVMPLLTGKNIEKIYAACSKGMDMCNHMIIWSEFRKMGYVTATGEDYIRLPDTFGHFGYKSPPTDHYLRPLFLTGENVFWNLVCTKKEPSTGHILDYATMFAENYKDDKFFGMFWFNSYSHNPENIPTLIDSDIVSFFENLKKSGVTNNTFIFFLSDHGMRYGKMRESYESYYEERLPMLFMWVPFEFQKMYPKEYMNLKINQNRLITPYDMYITFLDILTKANTSIENKAEGCPNCMSTFNEISPQRTCADANVHEKWCTCHKMEKINLTDNDTQHSLDLTVASLQNRIRNVKTKSCMKCMMLNLKNVLRTHTYRDELLNSTYYVLAFVMTPGDVGYEATVVKRNETFSIMAPTYTISPYNTRGNCVLNSADLSYCICKKINKCNSKV